VLVRFPFTDFSASKKRPQSSIEKVSASYDSMTVENTFFERYPELHHYTSWDGLKGIVTLNTLWATHYKYLNDLTEIEHMKEYLGNLVPARNRRERKSTKKEIEKTLYEKTFTQFITPYIASFSTHTNGSEFDRENGVLNQWKKSTNLDGVDIGGYGRHGYAIVFDTKLLDELMGIEFETYCYTQTTFSNIVYNQGLDHFKMSFEPLIKETAWFIWERILPQDYSRAEIFINDFIKTTVSFKHSKWNNECEVRIVASPKCQWEIEKYISDNDRDDIKALKNRQIKEICHREKDTPFIKLFEKLGVDLPIKRIIVAPDENQEHLWRQAVELVENKIPVFRSKVKLPTIS